MYGSSDPFICVSQCRNAVWPAGISTEALNKPSVWNQGTSGVPSSMITAKYPSYLPLPTMLPWISTSEPMNAWTSTLIVVVFSDSGIGVGVAVTVVAVVVVSAAALVAKPMVVAASPKTAAMMVIPLLNIFFITFQYVVVFFLLSLPCLFFKLQGGAFAEVRQDAGMTFFFTSICPFAAFLVAVLHQPPCRCFVCVSLCIFRK